MTDVTANDRSPVRSKRKRSDGEEARQPGAARRKIACETCRARKIRCSRDRPRCTFCEGHDSQCIYIETSEDKIILDPATRLIVSRLDQILSGVEDIRRPCTRATASLQWQTTQDTTSDQSPFTFNAERANYEAAKDYLVIPSCQASADTVLTWPIFRDRYQSNDLIRFQYNVSATDSYGEHCDLTKDDKDIDSTVIPGLIDRFLQNVHTKNPILDVRKLVLWGRRAVTLGITWDARSCIILLACALGSISRPFHDTLHDFQAYSNRVADTECSDHRSASTQRETLNEGEEYFILACKRLGLLKHTILGSQCHFYAAVYLMYTFRPLPAWSHFYQSSSFYQFYLRGVGGPNSDEPHNHDFERLQSLSRQERRLEQTIYWSCFKSETEMRVELPLALSTITSFEYPSMFPSPPTPHASAENGALPTAYEVSAWHKVLDATYGSNIREWTEEYAPHESSDDAYGQIHLGALYNEEESWFYYLTEVALRRISNRIINSFYRVPRDAWLEPERWTSIAIELEAQTETWSANLPAAMQTFDASPLKLLNQRISPEKRQSITESLDERKESVSKELSWCTENRLLEMRSWLFQPFLYCIIHQPLASDGGSQPWTSLPEAQHTAFQELVAAGIECNLRILHWRALFHRHHGIWFDIRAVITAVITLCGLARSGNVQVPLCLFFDTGPSTNGHGRSCGTHQLPCISFETIFDRLRYWEDETLDVRQSRLLIEDLVQTVRMEINVAASA